MTQPAARPLLPTILALALPLLACGNVASIPGVSPDQAPKQLAEAICPKAYECCMTADLMGNAQAGTDVASCESKTEAALVSQVAGIKASEKKGRVVYDGLKVEACKNRLHTATCAELGTTNHLSGVAECASFLTPKVAPGGACGADFECVGGSCDRSAVPSGQPGDGVCRAFGQLGDVCGSTAPCASELTCDATTMTCKARPPGGQPPTNACFYASACSYAGGDRGAASLLTVGLLALAIARRRRARSQRVRTV